jgi:RimJ/RimL family protein N-acetyltransferase
MTSPPRIETERLRLDPLRTDDADEMAGVLAAPSLYAFTGGGPPTRAELRRRYAAQVVGRSADGRERWLNWILRRRVEGDAIGFVQATVVEGGADVAWVIGVPWQRHGYAAEAAGSMLAWLVSPEPGGAGVRVITAHIHPDHAASSAVARRLGLGPTDDVEDGEIVWRAGALDLRLRALARWAPELETLGGSAGTWAGGEADADGVIRMPYVVLSERILAFTREMTALGWIHPFDWPAWAGSPAGRRYLEDSSRIGDAPADDLGRLLTTIVRSDRFSEGEVLAAAESGVLAAIARRAATLLARGADPGGVP